MKVTLTAVLVGIVLLCSTLSAQETDTGTIILDTSGFWRVHFTVKPPVVRKEQKVETLGFRAKWVMRGTPLPPEDWAKPDFDDSSWARFPGVCHVSPHYHFRSYKPPFMALECMRGKFTVTDPTRAGELTLSASYRGGIVVYINGREVARGHLPKGGGPGQLAVDYPFEKYDPKHPETKHRSLTDVKIPAGVLRKGVNILAIEVHRAAYHERDVKRGRKNRISINWGSCGLMNVRLKSPGGVGVVPNVARPNGLQVWNSNPMQVDCDLDYGDPNEELKPIYVVGTPNGAFSGKVMVGSPQPIKGLNAVMSDLKQIKGRGKVAASAVQVRYPKADWHQAGMSRRYMQFPSCFGGLKEFPPCRGESCGPKKRTVVVQADNISGRYSVLRRRSARLDYGDRPRRREAGGL